MGHRWSIKTAAAAAAAGAVWTAVMLRFAGPTIVGFAAAAAPRVRAAVVAWLAPPYLYLVVNAIILSIAASSRFRAAPSGSDPDPDPDPDSAAAEIAVAAVGEVEEEVVVERERERESVDTVEAREEEKEEEEEMVREKPLFSVRLGHQNRRSSKKPASNSEAGKALRVARPRRVETLESTWRTITEGRAVPLARHLRKSDTWEVRGGRSGNDDESPLEPPPMRKAETFHESGGPRGSGEGAGSDGGGGGGGGKVRREPSLGQEELNRRVEAFINKFNEDMRLQRQRSLLRYMQMINQGSR